MNIKNRLYMSAGISIILVVTLFSLVLVTSGRIAQGSKKHELLYAVRGGVSELDIITYDYLLHREKRMEQQWNSKYNSLAVVLEEATAEGTELPESILAGYTSFGDLFSQVTANYENTQKLIQEKASQEEIDAAIGLEERLVAQLLITSHSVITDASRLAAGAQTEVMDAQRLAANLTVILMVLLVVTVTASSLLVARSISKPLDELIKGAEIIGKGDLKHKVEVKSKDELGGLATAFNKMTESLKKVTASRDELDREITERKRAEKELRKSNEELQTAEEELRVANEELVQTQEEMVHREKLAILGQLAGGVGHELRNPLGAIKNAAYFLNMALEQPEPEVKETLDILDREVTTSERIISSLLDFARPKPPTRQKVDINSVVQETLSRAGVPGNVKVVSQLDETLPAILADSDQLGQVFGNIILNAVQAMPEGGQLVVKSEVPSPEWAAISFADTGAGIPKGDLKKLFEPLFTTKAKGIGLGLAVTKTIVEGHKGTIEVQSEVGKGSTFTVKLPIGGEEEK